LGVIWNSIEKYLRKKIFNLTLTKRIERPMTKLEKKTTLKGSINSIRGEIEEKK
jgi:hypothetical protein